MEFWVDRGPERTLWTHQYDMYVVFGNSYEPDTYYLINVQLGENQTTKHPKDTCLKEFESTSSSSTNLSTPKQRTQVRENLWSYLLNQRINKHFR